MGCFIPELKCVDHLHLCLVGRGLDREFQITLEIFDWVYVWTLLSLRQPSVVLSCYLRPWDQSPCPSLYGIPPHHDASTTDKLGSIILENLVCLRDLYMSYFFKCAFHWVEVSGWTLWSRLLIRCRCSRCRSFNPMVFPLKYIIGCESVYRQIMSNRLDLP